MSQEPTKVTVPFTYGVSYKARSWTHDRKVKFASAVDIILHHVDPSDAPVAMRLSCTSDQSYGRQVFRPKADGSPREVRWIEDGFWVEHGPVEDLADMLTGGTGVEETPFAETVDTRAFHAPPTKYEKDSYGRITKKPDVPSGVQTPESLRAYEEGMRYINDDGGAEVAGTIVAAASRCRVVDGVVFESIPEPILGLSSYVRHLGVRVAREAGHGFQGMTALSSATLGRIDSAEGMLLKSGTRHEPDTPGPVIEILRPDLVLRHPEGDDCLSEAQSVLESLSRWQSGLPTNWLAPCAVLAASLRGAPRLPNRAIAEALRGIAAQAIPGPEEAARLRWIAQRRHDETKFDSAMEGLPALQRRVRAILPVAERLAALYERPGRLDASVSTLGATREGGRLSFRLRQARSREDVRRAARLLGERFGDLEARLAADPDLDLVMFEGPDGKPGPGDDMRPCGVVEVDLATGAISRYAGDAPDPAHLEGHLALSWPDSRPEPANAGPGIGR